MYYVAKLAAICSYVCFKHWLCDWLGDHTSGRVTRRVAIAETTSVRVC
jgi:hypothetical protein